MTNNKEIEIEQITKRRVQLLSEKYSNNKQNNIIENDKINQELEVLNNRLLEISPLVAPEQFKALDDANKYLIKIQLARAERKKRLGLTGE